MPFPKASRALERFTVLDLTRVRSGPTCVRQLADWGANVIKIELPPEPGGGEPLGGPREGSDFQNLHRNKRSMTLNLKAPEAVAAFKRMVKKADVVVENFRPDVKRRLGIDYPQLRKINPKLVYASISGFGQTGPYAARPGFDQIAQGMGGLMSITGLPGQGPVRVGIPIADLTAGLFCALGILVALLEREKSKQGQHVTTSLLQAQIFMLDFQGARWLIEGDVPKQAGNNHPTSIPTGVFKTADGHINIASTGSKIWARFCAAADASGAAAAAGISDGRRTLEEPRRAQRRYREVYGQAHERRMDRAAQQGRRSVRADLFGRPGLRRPAGRASRHSAGREDQGQVQAAHGGPADVAVAYAEPSWWRARPSSASIPMRCSRSSGSARRTSRRCAKRTRFDGCRRVGAHDHGARRTSDGRRDQDRQDALAQGRARRLRDLQQPRASQRGIARHVGGDQPHPRGFRQGRRGARRRADRRRRQGLRIRVPTSRSSRASAPRSTRPSITTPPSKRPMPECRSFPSRPSP